MKGWPAGSWNFEVSDTRSLFCLQEVKLMFLLTLFADVNDEGGNNSLLLTILIVLAIIAVLIYILRRAR